MLKRISDLTVFIISNTGFWLTLLKITTGADKRAGTAYPSSLRNCINSWLYKIGVCVLQGFWFAVSFVVFKLFVYHEPWFLCGANTTYPSAAHWFTPVILCFKLKSQDFINQIQGTTEWLIALNSLQLLINVPYLLFYINQRSIFYFIGILRYCEIKDGKSGLKSGETSDR